MRTDAVPGFDPEHYYYDRAGQPITLMQWAQQRQSGDCIVQEDTVPSGILKTVYLGLVCPMISDARLFGSALIVPGTDSSGERVLRIEQLQVYDSEDEATLGHMAHLDAIALHHHCHQCRVGKSHVNLTERLM
jgi:hypothetical protein